MTRFFLAACLMLAAAVPVSGQMKYAHFPLIDSIYKQWKEHQFKIPGSACDTFYYVPAVSPELLEGIKELLAEKQRFVQHKRIDAFRYADTTNAEVITFTKAEIDSIIKQLDFIKQLLWPDNLYGPASQTIPGQKVDARIDSISAKKDSIEKRLCHTIYYFSVPILFRNDTLCLFYDGEADILSHFGKLWLYRRENNVWVPFSPVGEYWHR